MESRANSVACHSKKEFGNLWASQGLIKEWVSHPEWQSYNVLSCLYESLNTEKRFTPKIQNFPKLGNILRSSNAFLTGFSDNLLAEPKHIYSLTVKFSDKLDEILRQTSKTTEQAIHDAAFSYYVFERIHPFSDGNGRIGRMILKRVFKGAGVKDPIFHDQRWYGHNRSSHLDSLNRVNNTNNLAHLELFLAKALIHMYDPIKERQKYIEIEEIIERKKSESQENAKTKKLEDIWNGFTGISLYGN